jgi:hypothetical protein
MHSTGVAIPLQAFFFHFGFMITCPWALWKRACDLKKNAVILFPTDIPAVVYDT